MFRSTYQRGLVSVLFAGGSRPLAIWGSHVRNGHVRRVVDEDTRCLVLELAGTNVATTYVFCPPGPRGSLAVRLPFFAMLVKNLRRYFSFEIQVLDDKDMRRRFRVSNFKSCTRVHAFSCHMPIGLNPGWNLVQFNLADFVRRAYGTTYVETQRIQLHANCRVRRIYFSDRIYSEEELPADYKLYAPCQKKTRPSRPTVTAAAAAETTAAEPPPADAHHLQITLPPHASLTLPVPPPSDDGSAAPDAEDTPRPEDVVLGLQPSAPEETGVEPSAPGDDLDLGEAGMEPSAPAEASLEPSAPEEAREEPAALDEAGAEVPAPDEPGTDAPPPDEPTMDTPAPDEPPTDTPAADEPAKDTPAPDELGTDTPALDEPSAGTSAPDEPPTDTPAADEPDTGTPAPDEPASGSPAPNEPPTDTPAPEEASGTDSTIT